MRFRSSLLLAIACASVHAAAISAAKDKSPESILQGWDPAKSGALLVPLDEPGGGNSTPEPLDPMTCGKLTVLAPRHMVILDAGLKDTPNLYDGLPLQSKIVYLMSTLTPQQWQVASTDGIGFADLNQDQRLVFKSILPTSYRWIAEEFDKDGQSEHQVGAGDLTPDEISRIRIHFFRELSFYVRLQNLDGYTGALAQSFDRHGPGEIVYRHDWKQAQSGDSLYGVQIRKVLPNRLKPSDLDYGGSRLDKPVDVPAKANVQDLLRLVSQSAGIDLVADPRFGWRSTEFKGGPVRSGDLLQALALTLTGTFRKVGETYVLTSDLEGLGTRFARIGAWATAIRDKVREREAEWQRAIAKSSGFAKVGFAANDPFAPNDAVRKWTADHLGRAGLEMMPFADLPPNLQELLRRAAKRVAQSQPIQIDQAGPVEDVMWNFVLPDGKQIEWEDSSLNTEVLATTSSHDWKTDPPEPVKPLALPAGKPASLAIRTDDPQAAADVAAAAARYGFRELWLQTAEPKCLDAAIAQGQKSGVAVRLLVRPWEAAASALPTDPDRTIFGDTAPQAAVRRSREPRWEDATEYPKVPTMPVSLTIGPDDPSTSRRWAAFAALGNRPGLGGVVLCDTEPLGYEPAPTRVMYYERPLAAEGALGYSAATRQRFLAQNSLDPIDIVDDTLIDWDIRNGVDFSLPMFDQSSQVGAANDGSAPLGALTVWDGFAAKANQDATLRLAGMFGGPVLVEARRATQDLPPTGQVSLLAWQPGQDLPVYDDQPWKPDDGPKDSIALVRLGAAMSPRVAGGVWHNLSARLKGANPVAVDLTTIPADQWPQTLAAWFAPRS